MAKLDDQGRVTLEGGVLRKKDPGGFRIVPIWMVNNYPSSGLQCKKCYLVFGGRHQDAMAQEHDCPRKVKRMKNSGETLP